MEKLIIKMVDKHYETEKDIRNVIKYIAGEGKNENTQIILRKKGKGVSKNVSKAASQIIAVQKALGKDHDRRLYHMIVSFPKDMHNKKLIKNAAEDIADMLFEAYQVYYGIHISKEHWHIHFAINAVSYMTKKKWHQNADELAEMKIQIHDLVAARYRDDN